MTIPASGHLSEPHERATARHGGTVDPHGRGLYRAGGVAALVMVTLVLVQVIVYAVWTPPAFDGPPWFELLQENRLLGLLSLDLLHLVDSTLLVVM